MFSLSRQVIVLAVLLAFVGLFYIYHKHYVLGLPITPVESQQAWAVGIELNFDGRTQRPIKLELAIPKANRQFSRFEETLLVGDFGSSYSMQDQNRVLTLTKRRASGIQKLYYQTTLVRRDEVVPAPAVEKPSKLPSKPVFNKLQQLAADQLIEEVRASSADIASFTVRILERINSRDKKDNMSLFLSKRTDAESKAQLAQQLLALANISSRIVYGIELKNSASNADVLVRLEVFDEKRWLSFDPVSASANVPNDFLIWSRDFSPLLSASGVRNLQYNISVAETLLDPFETALRSAEEEHYVLASLSLTSLPVVTQNALKILLMIPVGVFAIIILRTIVGLKTFGTFAPVLIAIAFIQTRLALGLMLFVGIVTIALMVRFYFERLKLLLVPRLAAVVTVIVLILVILNITFHGMGLTLGLSSSLLPIVILAMVVERMSLSWEEVGAWEAIKQGIGSLIAAIIGYLVITIEEIQFFVFIYPESLLVLLAIMIVLGRYTGYRLTELGRFKDFG